jgi:hypothetical protein
MQNNIPGILEKNVLLEYEKRIQETNERLARISAESELTTALCIAKALESQGLEISAIVCATGLSSEIIATL